MHPPGHGDPDPSIPQIEDFEGFCIYLLVDQKQAGCEMVLVQLSLLLKNVDIEQLHVDFIALLSGQTPQEGPGLGLRRV